MDQNIKVVWLTTVDREGERTALLVAFREDRVTEINIYRDKDMAKLDQFKVSNRGVNP